MTQLPTLFVSHGAPTLAIDDGPAHRFLRACGGSLGKPKAILVLSAHFDTPMATITAGTSPETIYDFRGFPDKLYEISYPAPGDPNLAGRISELLTSAGLPVQLDRQRGLDHGAWVPLSLIYPDANIPVMQLSIDSRTGTAYHFHLGELLRPLRDEGVLIVGSGGVTHNLSHALHAPQNEPIVEWANTFREWVAEAVDDDRRDDLANFRDVAPYAARNHPSDEHFLPLLCVMGATEPGESRRRIHASDTYGALAMDAYMFGTRQDWRPAPR
ncbi:MAG: class III extradiol ring-cleavage dioxygenase [Woeseiaceae bacterium]|nr:class III extradiol ring-cleavage dioxygenase [Woeseiaceae bacterium]